MLKFSEIFEFSKEKFRKIPILKEFEWFKWFECFGPSPIEPFNSGAHRRGRGPRGHPGALAGQGLLRGSPHRREFFRRHCLQLPQPQEETVPSLGSQSPFSVGKKNKKKSLLLSSMFLTSSASEAVAYSQTELLSSFWAENKVSRRCTNIKKCVT